MNSADRRARSGLGGLLVIAVGLSASCTEDPLSVGGPLAPGATTETRDVTLSSATLADWRDTTVTGFALPSNSSFLYASNDPELPGRPMGRFNIPDTLRTFVDTLPVADFDSVTILLRVDTLRSVLDELPLTFRIIDLSQPFDRDGATWNEYTPGMPWATPGGDLGVEIASGQLEAEADSILMGVSVPEDSLMRAWQEKDGGNGFAVVLDGPSARVRLSRIVLRYEPTLEGRTLPVPQTQDLTDRTFITDPTLPPSGMDLRLGGIPASRLYLEFSPPDLVDGVPLAGATINHAELILHPLPAPPDPFAAELPIAARQITLLGDPFELGAKTPIGSGDAAVRALEPELLSAGEPLGLDITLLIASAAGGGLPKIRIGLRADPNSQTLGYWEFGSVESAPQLRPELRIVFSPPPDFGVP